MSKVLASLKYVNEEKAVPQKERALAWSQQTCTQPPHNNCMSWAVDPFLSYSPPFSK